MMRVLDLFSGIGGFSLGLESTGAFQTVAFCEIEEFPRKVLKKHWPHLPIHEDIHHVSGYAYRGIDLIVGGFPCQPISIAGKGKGKEDERWLWPEFFRVIREARPRWCIIENSPRLRTLHGDDVLGDLEELGYTCWPLVVGAGAAGAPHKRKRVWVVAHTERNQLRQQQRRGSGQDRQGQAELGNSGQERVVAHADSPGLAQHAGQRGNACQEQSALVGGNREVALDTDSRGHDGQERMVANSTGQRRNTSWGSSEALREPGAKQRFARCDSVAPGAEQWSWANAPEPVLRGVDDGLPCGVDRRERLKALGNSVVPQITRALGLAILWTEMIEL